MKKYLAVLVLSLSGCSTIDYGDDYKRHAEIIDQAITAIKIALSNVENELVGSNLKLDKATLTLSTGYTQTKESKGTIFILGGGKSSTNGFSDKVVINLKPIPSKVKSSAVNMTQYLSERLTKTIASTIDGISNIQSGSLPLLPESIEIEQAISIKSTVTIGGDYETEIIPVTFGASSKKEKNSGHTLKIILKRKSD